MCIVTAEKKTVPIHKRTCTEMREIGLRYAREKALKVNQLRRLYRVNVPETVVNSGDK